MASGIVTLTTDFGHEDPYAGITKGVILSINPEARIVDLCHEVTPQDVEEAAFILSTAYRHFPLATVHVVVVDPEVGSTRPNVALRTADQIFVCPDNGLVSFVLARNVLQEAVVLNKPELHRHPIAATFHGRDIFAPVAAHLSLGKPLGEVGSPISRVKVFSVPAPVASRGGWQGQVLHVDRFGNLITNITNEELGDLPPRQLRVELVGRAIYGIRSFYAEVKKGELVAYVGSSGHLEIGAREASAARMLRAERGALVRVVRVGVSAAVRR